MKLFIFVFVFLCSTPLLADAAFEIPRSTVIELKEPKTDRVYPLFIKFPRSYHSDAKRKYPVIYLTDAWYSFQLVSGAIRFPMNSGVMEEAIIVGISYSEGSSGSSSRIRDYTPIKVDSWKRETGNADGHIKFIKNTVFPHIESHYRASSTQRTFVGNSLGGLLGTYILFTQPNMFSSYIIGSPSVWFNDNYILSESVKIPTRPVRVYLSVGSLERPEYGQSEDMVADAKALEDKLNGYKYPNLDLKLSIIEGARHATAFPTTVIQGLDWLYGK
nr:alpha/beta hydrolase-fold protein [Shewanella canadensis]